MIKLILLLSVLLTTGALTLPGAADSSTGQSLAIAGAVVALVAIKFVFGMLRRLAMLAVLAAGGVYAWQMTAVAAPLS